MRLFKSNPKADEFYPPEGMNMEQEKQWRVSRLANDERAAFEWFRLGYTARWTAETMLLDQKTAKRLFGSIYRKLGVTDEVEVSRIYRTVKLTPGDIPPEEEPTPKR